MPSKLPYSARIQLQVHLHPLTISSKGKESQTYVLRLRRTRRHSLHCEQSRSCIASLRTWTRHTKSSSEKRSVCSTWGKIGEEEMQHWRMQKSSSDRRSVYEARGKDELPSLFVVWRARIRGRGNNLRIFGRRDFMSIHELFLLWLRADGPSKRNGDNQILFLYPSWHKGFGILHSKNCTGQASHLEALTNTGHHSIVSLSREVGPSSQLSAAWINACTAKALQAFNVDSSHNTNIYHTRCSNSKS